jgi:predicted permease
MKTEILIGILLGFVANVVGMILYVFIFLDQNLTDAIYKIKEFNLMGGIIALGAALNFLPFFLLLKKNKVYMARGVLIATIIAALITLIYKINIWIS